MWAMITAPIRQRKLNLKLVHAIGRGAVDEARALLQEGADANANNGRECILSCAGRSPESNAECVRLLLEWGADVQGTPRGRAVSPIIRASHQSDDARIRLLVEHRAELNLVQTGTPGFTPLQELVRWAELDTLTLLLDRGADPNFPSLFRRLRALHVAVVSGRPEVVALLLSRGAEPAARDADGHTALDLGNYVLNERLLRGQREDPKTARIRAALELLR